MNKHELSLRTRAFAVRILKMIDHVVLEEADETLLWLEMIAEAKMLPAKGLSSLMKESDELVRIFAATHRTVKSNARRPKS